MNFHIYGTAFSNARHTLTDQATFKETAEPLTRDVFFGHPVHKLHVIRKENDCTFIRYTSHLLKLEICFGKRSHNINLLASVMTSSFIFDPQDDMIK